MLKLPNNGAEATGAAVPKEPALTAVDVRNTTLLALLLLAWSLYIGFPFLTADSLRYLIPSVQPSHPPEFSPTILPVLIGPIAKFLGPWAFVLVSGLCLLWVLVRMSKLMAGRIVFWPCALAVVFGTMYLRTNEIMMDVYVPLAFAAAFVLLERRPDAITAAVLILCVLAHSAIVPVLFAVVAIWSISPFRNLWRGSTVVTLALTSLLIVFVIHVVLFNHWSPYPKYARWFLFGIVTSTFPDITMEYVKENPNSELAGIEKLLADELYWDKPWAVSEQSRRVSRVMWGKGLHARTLGEHISEEQCSDLYMYILKNHPLTMFWRFAGNSAYFLTLGLPRHFALDTYVFTKEKDGQLAMSYPGWIPSMRDGLQFRIKDDERLRRLYSLSVPTSAAAYLSLLYCAFCAGAVFLRRKTRAASVTDRFAIYALIAFLANAVVVANLSGLSPRYFQWMLFPPLLASLFSLAERFRRRMAIQTGTAVVDAENAPSPR